MSTPDVAFVGLGAMGYAMAGHVAAHAAAAGTTLFVWNRTSAVAEKHAAEHAGSEATQSLRDVAGCSIVFMCLPKSDVVREVVDELTASAGGQHSILFVDCTSGDPLATQAIAATASAAGHQFVDAPVSGGPAGAQAGKLAVLVGGTDAAVALALPWLSSFAKKVEHLGPVGAGHATKAVNNALNATHLLAGAEGLIALQRFGIAPERALAAINVSSGRSLQTEQRLPQTVLSRSFDYGFKLELMNKDLKIADGLMANSSLPEGGGAANYFGRTSALYGAALSALGEGADYTEAVKLLEQASGTELHATPPRDETARSRSPVGARGGHMGDHYLGY